MDYIVFIVLVCYSIYLLIMAYLIGFKGKLNLIYSIDQVKMSQQSYNKRLSTSRYISCIYIITSIGLLVSGYIFY